MATLKTFWGGNSYLKREFPFLEMLSYEEIIQIHIPYIDPDTSYSSFDINLT